MGKRETLHFSITGEFITRQARAFWDDERDPVRALRLLGDIDGLDLRQTFDILEGRSKFIGDSSTGLQLVDDGEYEGPSLIEQFSLLAEKIKDLEDEIADRVQMKNGSVEIVASPTGPRAPAMWPPARPPTRTLEDERADEEREARAMAVLRKMHPPEDKITHHTGWLSPDGKFFKCEYGQHNSTAEIAGFDPFSEEAELWVRCFRFPDSGQVFSGEHEKFTEKQNELIRLYCRENNKELPFWLE